MSKAVHHPSKVQLNLRVTAEIKKALFELAALAGLSVPECLSALIREAQKKAGL